MIKKVFFVIILLILFYDLYEILNISNYLYVSKNKFKNNNHTNSIFNFKNIYGETNSVGETNSISETSSIGDNNSESETSSVSDNNSESESESESDDEDNYIKKIKNNNMKIHDKIQEQQNMVDTNKIISQQQEIIKYQQSIINQQNQTILPENSDSLLYKNVNHNMPINNEIPVIKHPNNKEIKKEKKNIVYEEIDINKYGKPYDYKPNEYIHWDFYDPQPWTKIIYKYGNSDPYNFYIKAKIPSLNDYENWKNYLTNINFDPRSGEIIISCQDEETALSIANLLVTNFKGDIKFEEIVNKDLIGISIIKCKKYEVVKNKIKEQIIQNMVVKATNFNDLNKQMESKQKNVQVKNDDNESNNYFYYSNANNKKKNNEFDAYDGNEYSFL